MCKGKHHAVCLYTLADTGTQPAFFAYGGRREQGLLPVLIHERVYTHMHTRSWERFAPFLPLCGVFAAHTVRQKVEAARA